MVSLSRSLQGSHNSSLESTACRIQNNTGKWLGSNHEEVFGVIRSRRQQSEKLGNAQPVIEEETMDYHGSSISVPLNIIVDDILSRLPTKTIIRCRCVCWTFRKIISDKYFANLHLLRSPGCLVIHHFDVDGYSSAYTVNELKDKPYPNSLQHNQLMKFDLK
ncbi:hypothetical protein RJ639_019933 [Escallonia herrerae]|uniref:F-box domain-containing protein n=1 Tax=Escallonia herrerae TaxID=1293975 RepID=A0AA89AJP4_9ASTE|nr:hypothetical protein RJ639_019933 [Escallonia herrerae]